MPIILVKKENRMCHHGVVTFLGIEEELGKVDPEFRGLVEQFHRIPFCATFGVSCAGHFYEKWDELDPDLFWPRPWGHLNVIVCSGRAHIRELLEILRVLIREGGDATFKKIDHIFLPRFTTLTELWEIRIGDNSCMTELGEGYCGQPISKVGYPLVFEAAKRRVGEIHSFWQRLEAKVLRFCEGRSFPARDLARRMEEIAEIWNEEEVSAR